MSPFPMENPPSNYTTIDISDIKTEMAGKFDIANKNRMNLISKFKFLYSNSLHMTNITLQHPAMKKLMKSNEKFDLIILDLFLTDALLGLSTVFNCPIVALSTNGPHTWAQNVLGSKRSASHLPHMYTDFTKRLNLGRRLEDAIFYLIENIYFNVYHLPQQKELYEKVFSESNRTFEDVRVSSVVLSLVNSHFSISFPKPFLPNAVDVPGMQINEDIMNPLPDDIKDFIESSEHGIIYISLNNKIKSSTMDVEKKRDLIAALSSLKQNTIWQFDEDNLNVDPKKIMIRKWSPQYEILRHANTKIFVTSADLSSCTEAIYFAKNVIAVPIFGEQHRNARKLAKSNQGVLINYFNLTSSSLTWAVDAILSNPV